MQKGLKKFLAVLDGRPTGMRGQSLVELAITFPIFMLMMVGMVEIGWFANNYLILSDVVRSAGRWGSLRDPMEWVQGEEKNYQRLDCDIRGDTYNTYTQPGEPDVTSRPITLPGFFDGTEGSDLGFFDGVACSVITNMPPLRLNDDQDDIVVSVFSYGRFDNCGSGPCIKVTGRYPSGQNECEDDSRDPFDFINNNIFDPEEELSDYPAFNPIDGGGRSSDGFRGFVFRGNQLATTSCLGSKFSLDWMEERLNAGLVDESVPDMTALELGMIPNYGLVLVEVTYGSDQLLGLPFFTWAGDPIVIHIWSIFPVSAAEPDVQPNWDIIP
jgi:hypothetical protein